MSLKTCTSIYFITFLQFQVICIAVPIYHNEDSKRTTLWSNATLSAVFGVICGVCLILAVGICVCCDKNRFKFLWSQRRNQRVPWSNTQNGFLTNGHEVAIFPPPGAEQYLTSSTSNLSSINFEPLPDITSQLHSGPHPPRLSGSVASNLNEDWFAEPYKNFPRNQLQYVRKLGSGWFGQVLEGRAIGVDTDHTSTVIMQGPFSKATPVVVKALREDVSQQEQALFLQELIPYRDLNHHNILKIVAYCIEMQPLLVLLQYCPKGDLKSLLKRDQSLTDDTLVKMAENVSAGLAFMHQHNFIHTDLAARNCVVEDDLNIKIGDYGFSVEAYKDDYYIAENVALPIRWCAPETLRCTETTIETIQLTKAANVWSFGVLLWEIFSSGRLPYDDLDEDGIIQKVILERSFTLQLSMLLESFYLSKLCKILELCFMTSENRPSMVYLHSLLQNLEKCGFESSSDVDFEERWNQLSDDGRIFQKHNITVHESSLIMRFESNFTPRVSPSDKGSPTASLRNFHGSAEDLDSRIAAKFGSALPSWLELEPGQVMDSFTEEISDAIQRLDEALSEDRSESTTSVCSPEKATFRLGGDSLVMNHPGIHRTLSDGDEENLTMRLEQGDFSELVRLKSQSVQDFMRLTVVDDGSDSDKTSQPGSLVGEFVPQIRPQEKNFSSESNLKEAVRDAGFMFELERLQAGHKFSIISEASREGMSSMEGVSSRYGNASCFRVSKEETDTLSDSAEDSYMPTCAEGKQILPIPFYAEMSKPLEVSEKSCGEASPDCIVSSQVSNSSAPLPDIVAHNTALILASSSDSSVDDTTKTTVLPFLNHESRSLDYLPEKSSFQGTSVASPLELSSPELMAPPKESTRKEISWQQNIVLNNKTQNYYPENLVLGEDIIIGALDDYSLEPFKPAKSNSTGEETCDDGANLSKNFDCLNLDERGYNNDNIHSFILNSQNSETNLVNNCSHSLDDNSVNLENFSAIPPYSDLSKTEAPFVSQVNMNQFFFSEDKGNSAEEDENLFTSSNLNESLDNAMLSRKESYASAESSLWKPVNYHADSQNGNLIIHNSASFKGMVDKTLSESDDIGNKESERGKKDSVVRTKDLEQKEAQMTPDMNRSSEEGNAPEVMKTKEPKLTNSCIEMRSGEFWEQQMVAWQEAAEETRALLQAAHTEEAITPHNQIDEDLLFLNQSPQSSYKSPSSSMDPLDDTDDDERTYVSYDTTDDDDAVRFNHKDILAIRSELHLKLPDADEVQDRLSEQEAPHDLVFINYKSSCALSPIKEEHHIDFTEIKDDSSIEFGERSRPTGTAHFIPPLPLNSEDETKMNICTLESSSDNTKDSLIFEDLESDGATTVVRPIRSTPSSEDLLVVDTATNQATLINSERPQSLLAFQVEKDYLDPFSSMAPVVVPYDTIDDDVAPVSLPYKESSSLVVSRPFQKEELSIPLDQNASLNVHDNEAPHYQSYFTSGLTSISYPTPSLERGDPFQSEDHISLPYEVNLPLDERSEPLEKEEVSNSEPMPKHFSDIEENEPFTDPPPSDKDSFVTLSFLGRLYSDADNKDIENHLDSVNMGFLSNTPNSIEQNSSMEYFSMKSETDSSDDGEIEEELPIDGANEKVGGETPTPVRTPSHLDGFVWQPDANTEPRYTPDWETDSEGNEDIENSSLSSDFIWQPGNGTSSGGVTMPLADNTSLEWQIANEKREEESRCSPVDDDDSESGEEEFTPSTWNRDLTPHRSLLKSPETLSGGKKSVHWKRQRHHRVYEYPPEPHSWHSDVSNSKPRRVWGGHSLDYLTLADWELAGEDSEDFEEFFSQANDPLGAPQIYSLGALTYDNQEDFYSDGKSFFMGTSSSPFAFSSSCFTPAEFFPDESSGANYDFDFPDEKASPETTTEIVNEACQPLDTPKNTCADENKLSREKLRLDLPTLCLTEMNVQDKQNENLD